MFGWELAGGGEFQAGRLKNRQRLRRHTQQSKANSQKPISKYQPMLKTAKYLEIEGLRVKG
jgi:hypothetical protein